MTFPPRLGICDNSPHGWQLSSATPTHDVHVAFKIKYVQDYITKLSMRQADVLQNRGVHPASYSVSNEDLSPGVKRPGSEADNWMQSTAKAKNEWDLTSPHTCLHGMQRENFIFRISRYYGGK